ncbi:hypothetical protein RO3G_00853 [Lichtheimia corymbifera JMRC:FSU:9682]|uniref:protein-tyrosine-phosphatase n=1 Tax=Lichtheimia corymbifera JMRC:FSU:9682 TaxID=1263082 RepID=A0A068RZF5_9FUNG|nr:hypothetical protein RO3G_00853 [Lichtheimia corymbifera JMRC:FSU:9682]
MYVCVEEVSLWELAIKKANCFLTLWTPLSLQDTLFMNSTATHPTDVLADAFNQQASLSPGPMLTPSQLVGMLQNHPTAPPPLLIDVRRYDDYERTHIRHSLNVSIPSLLVKRYQRGQIVSNFPLESFIATEEGKEYYEKWRGNVIVVYDADRIITDHAAMLLTVLKNDQRAVYGVEGGFEAIWAHDPWANYMVGPPLMQASKSARTTSRANNGNNDAPNDGSNTNVHRRSSLFSLDTSRLHHYNRVKASRHHHHQLPPPAQPRKLAYTSAPTDNNNATITNINKQISRKDYEPSSTVIPAPCESSSFVISEIIPGFLFLGPEISDQEQLNKLLSHSIRRILNMAEECNDDVPGLKDKIRYFKLKARDTIAMENVEQTLREAVKVIDSAKEHHEPIYVHCKAGKSRSVAAILAYLVMTEHWSLKRAYQHVIKVRPSMSPNIGFVAELLKLEESIHGRTSNFATADWQSIDPCMPPSPDSQQAIRKVRMAWSSS